MEDRIRYFVEQCDWFQGFQVFSQQTDGYAAIIPSVMSDIRDDYSKKTVLIYDCQTTMDMFKENQKNEMTEFELKMLENNKSTLINSYNRAQLNGLICTHQLWEIASNIIPLSVDSWNLKIMGLNPSDPLITAAIMGKTMKQNIKNIETKITLFFERLIGSCNCCLRLQWLQL